MTPAMLDAPHAAVAHLPAGLDIAPVPVHRLTDHFFCRSLPVGVFVTFNTMAFVRSGGSLKCLEFFDGDAQGRPNTQECGLAFGNDLVLQLTYSIKAARRCAR